MTGSTRLRRCCAGLCVLLLAAAAAPAAARSLDGVTMPETVARAGETLQLNGLGLRRFTILRIHGYVAGLYVPQPARAAQTILDEPGSKLLRLHFLHAAGAGRVQDQLREQHASICAEGCPKSDEDSFAQLLQTARAVKPGDVTTYVYGPKGLQVLFNDESLAVIPDIDFARRMLAGMIGAHPPSAELRDGLLGGT